jgi:dienelactone hydrolase
MAIHSERYHSGTETVPADVFLPDGSRGSVPGVLVIHGSSGLSAQYQADMTSFADALSQNGIGAALPHYFAAARMRADADGLPLIGTHYVTWKRACEDALRFMAGDARFDASRLGVLGFSLGGHYALGLAMDPPSGTAVRCVVDFFGPTLSPPLSGAWSNMPPLLIHHGLDDGLVTLKHSEYLKAQLEKAEKKDGTDFHLETYEHQGHGFTGDALKTSRAATVAFFLKNL